MRWASAARPQARMALAPVDDVARSVALAGAQSLARRLWDRVSPRRRSACRPAVGVREHPYFAISQLVINGCGPALTPDDVRAWLGVRPASRASGTRRRRALRTRLEAHPFIARAARAARVPRPPRRSTCTSGGREAIAVLDELYYVDRSGATFGPLRRAGQPRLPADHRARRRHAPTGRAPGRCAAPCACCAAAIARRAASASCPRCTSSTEHGVVVYPAAPRVPVVLGWGSWPAKLERAERALRAWHGARRAPRQRRRALPQPGGGARLRPSCRRRAGARPGASSARARMRRAACEA